MSKCNLCPRECGTDREIGERGLCNAGPFPVVARAALHFWEEPCISGTRGSGAVFFSGCGLGCVFCQNAAISRASFVRTRAKDTVQEAAVRCGADGQAPVPPLPGREISVRHLAEVFLRLQNEERAHNLNLVTGTHFTPQIAEALRLAKTGGLHIPVVWNSSGYEKASTLRLLEGLVDVYLPDFKYLSPELAQRYSFAADYPERAKEALAEMVRQVGNMSDCTTAVQIDADRVQTMDGDGTAGMGNRLITRGVIVRHLVLPGHTREAKRVVQYLHDTYGDRIGISLLNQYTPMERVQADPDADPLLKRRLTRREYERVVSYALDIGVREGFVQEGRTAEESFIPIWDGTGV